MASIPKIFLLVPPPLNLLPRLEGFPYDIENYRTFEAPQYQWPDVAVLLDPAIWTILNKGDDDMRQKLVKRWVGKLGWFQISGILQHHVLGQNDALFHRNPWNCDPLVVSSAPPEWCSSRTNAFLGKSWLPVNSFQWMSECQEILDDVFFMQSSQKGWLKRTNFGDEFLTWILV